MERRGAEVGGPPGDEKIELEHARLCLNFQDELKMRLGPALPGRGRVASAASASVGLGGLADMLSTPRAGRLPRD